MKKKNRIIIWPQYFDKNLARNKGRKVSKKLAIEAPSLDHIIKAATELRLNFEIDNESRYPAAWWKPSGRILVDKTIPKYGIIKRMAAIINRLK
jgi:signal recognition particle subunit SRP19